MPGYWEAIEQHINILSILFHKIVCEFLVWSGLFHEAGEPYIFVALVL